MNKDIFIGILVGAVCVMAGVIYYMSSNGSSIYVPMQTEVTDKNTNSVTELQGEEVRKIVDEVSLYCEKYNIPGCLPISSYSVVDFNDKHSVVKINNFNYLLTKNSNEWNVSIASQESNICDTGSDSPDLSEYCRKK